MSNAVQLKSVPSTPFQIDTRRYAKCVEVSKRIRWDIDHDVIRGRNFDFSRNFLPEGLTRISRLQFLSEDERMLASQIQGRTYANMFALIERFIGAKVLELSREHWLGDQTALEALVRFTDEELKHQELFRRIERMMASGMPDGYRFVGRPNDVAWLVLGKSTWSVLALTCVVEIVTQAHYRESIAPEANLSELYKDVFLFHWKEESQHAILDEIEWRRENAKVSPRERDVGVTDLIDLAGAVDALVQEQAGADAAYFLQLLERKRPAPMSMDEMERVRKSFLAAYRWQYILSGAQDERFGEVLAELVTPEQGARISAAIAPLMQAA